MDLLQEYASSEDEIDSAGNTNNTNSAEIIAFSQDKLMSQSNFLRTINSTPDIEIEQSRSQICLVDPYVDQLMVNPKVNQFAPLQGPANPFKSNIELAKRNTLIGYIEKTHMDEFNFENQRRTIQSYGHSVKDGAESDPHLRSVFESAPKRKGDRRKKQGNYDGTDLDNYTGPWAKYVDEQTVSKPSEEDRAFYEEYNAKLEARRKRSKQNDNDLEPIESRTALHIESVTDYQGRSFMVPPQTEEGVRLRDGETPARCHIPTKLAHQWSAAHRQGVSVLRVFPGSGHLLLSAGMDRQVRLWELYGERRLLRSYVGHREPIKDVSFNTSGSEMLTSSYDKYVKLWDVETGACTAQFTNKHVANVVRFNPDLDKQHLFLAGCQNKKIVCYDVRSGEITQSYERHLGAVNSVTFFDNNRRFVSTSDDRSLRLWEWDIPVDYRQLADPSMHSLPSVALSPNGKWLACQSLDNQIVTYNLDAGFKKTRKLFRNQVAAGSACQIDFSPDMHYILSGDGDGNTFVWDFKTTKTVTSWKAHDKATISVVWLPHQAGKVVTGGWDGHIKLWD